MSLLGLEDGLNQENANLIKITMKHKLILIFDEDNLVFGVERYLVFNNVLDAESYLKSIEVIKSVEFDMDENEFYFKTNSWNGFGMAIWAVEP